MRLDIWELLLFDDRLSSAGVPWPLADMKVETKECWDGYWLIYIRDNVCHAQD